MKDINIIINSLRKIDKEITILADKYASKGINPDFLMDELQHIRKVINNLELLNDGVTNYYSNRIK